MESQTPPTPPSAAPTPTNWRVFLELSSLAVFVFPFGNILGPLVLWLIKKDSEPEVAAEGIRVLNFNISWTIWIFVTCGIGFFVWLVFLVIAIVKAANRQPYEHPLTLKLL